MYLSFTKTRREIMVISHDDTEEGEFVEGFFVTRTFGRLRIEVCVQQRDTSAFRNAWSQPRGS